MDTASAMHSRVSSSKGTPACHSARKAEVAASCREATESESTTVFSLETAPISLESSAWAHIWCLSSGLVKGLLARMVPKISKISP